MKFRADASRSTRSDQGNSARDSRLHTAGGSLSRVNVAQCITRGTNGQGPRAKIVLTTVGSVPQPRAAPVRPGRPALDSTRGAGKFTSLSGRLHVEAGWRVTIASRAVLTSGARHTK